MSKKNYENLPFEFYLRINGNMYSTMFQIVDGSTYNNLTSNSKYSSVTMKTMWPVRFVCCR